MKRSLPYLVLLLALLCFAAVWITPKVKPGEFDVSSFSRIPVLVGGRIKPLDTVARNSIIIMRGMETMRLPKVGFVSPSRWLADVLFNPTAANAYPVFAVANQEVLGLFGFPQADKRYCTFDELRPYLEKIEEERKLMDDVKPAERTPFQTAIYNLFNSLILYQQLKNSIQDEGTTNFAKEIDTYAAAVAAAGATVKQGGVPSDQNQLMLLRSAASRYQRQSEFAYMLTVAPPKGGKASDWLTTGNALIRLESPASIPASLAAFADMGDAFRAGDPATFSKVTREYAGWLAIEHPEWSSKTTYELRFNQMDPLFYAMFPYIGAFLLACVSWLILPESLRKSAVYLIVLAFVVHSFGMLSRMYLQGRPPVTNLYSSAVFVGWGAVLLGLVLERFYRDGIGAACSGLVGFVTLVIAHYLGASGDTLEMMQAVLDSNIWLATHVVVITFGYSAMFLAGVLAIAYVVLAIFTNVLSKESAKNLSRMIYGIVCFATLFSFVGTVLGGIWGDQSWGRFWGWDPKENGALLIVIWCAMILHARWGGFIRQRGLACMAILGNAITAFSWFGVNMLGVGLHSYGFMSKAFPWLVGFVIVQVVLVLVAQLPFEAWRSSAQTKKA